MVGRLPVVRKDGQNVQIPPGDALRLRGDLVFAPRVSVNVTELTDLSAVASNLVTLGSTGTVSSFGTGIIGDVKYVLAALDGIIIVRDGNQIEVPSKASITLAAGDFFIAECIAAGSWRVRDFQRADGKALAATPTPDPTKLPLAGGKMTGAINEAVPVSMALGVEIANGVQITNAASNTVFITDTGTLTFLGSGTPGTTREVEFTTSVTLQNTSRIILPGLANITTQAGDTAKFRNVGEGNIWKCVWYARQDGTPVITPSDSNKVSTSAVGAANGVAPLGADSKVPAAYLPTGNVFRIENIAATSVGQTSFAIPNGYTAGAIIPFFKGPVLAPADYTATDGANVVLAVGADAIGDVLTVVVLGALRAQDDALLQYTVAGLPAASANLAKQLWCTNMAGGAGVVVSNGTNWVRVADNTIVTV